MMAIWAVLVEAVSGITITLLLYPLVAFFRLWTIAPMAICLFSISLARFVAGPLSHFLILSAGISAALGGLYIFLIKRLNNDNVILVSVLVHLSIQGYLSSYSGTLGGSEGISISSKWSMSIAEYFAITCSVLASVLIFVATVHRSRWNSYVQLLRASTNLASVFGLDRERLLVIWSVPLFALLGLVQAVLISHVGVASADSLSLQKALVPLAIVLAGEVWGLWGTATLTVLFYLTDALFIYSFRDNALLAGPIREAAHGIVVLVALTFITEANRAVRR